MLLNPGAEGADGGEEGSANEDEGSESSSDEGEEGEEGEEGKAEGEEGAAAPEITGAAWTVLYVLGIGALPALHSACWLCSTYSSCRVLAMNSIQQLASGAALPHAAPACNRRAVPREAVQLRGARRVVHSMGLASWQLNTVCL